MDSDVDHEQTRRCESQSVNICNAESMVGRPGREKSEEDSLNRSSVRLAGSPSASEPDAKPTPKSISAPQPDDAGYSLDAGPSRPSTSGSGCGPLAGPPPPGCEARSGQRCSARLIGKRTCDRKELDLRGRRSAANRTRLARPECSGWTEKERERASERHRRPGCVYARRPRKRNRRSKLNERKGLPRHPRPGCERRTCGICLCCPPAPTGRAQT